MVGLAFLFFYMGIYDLKNLKFCFVLRIFGISNQYNPLKIKLVILCQLFDQKHNTVIWLTINWPKFQLAWWYQLVVLTFDDWNCSNLALNLTCKKGEKSLQLFKHHLFFFVLFPMIEKSLVAHFLFMYFFRLSSESTNLCVAMYA